MIETSIQITPRSVFCVIEHLHRDLAVAKQTCAGKFTHAGITLTLGTKPDWLTSPFPADAEWRIEWSKFYFGLDLAAAFNETGDPGFLYTWESLVRTWIEQVPTDLDPTDVIGRRIQNWIYAWIRFAAVRTFPGFTEAFAGQLLASIGAQVQYLRRNLAAERNHRTLELYALFIAALALPELDDHGELLTFSMEELHRNLLADIRDDGVHREHSTHYHMIVLRSFLAARKNAELFGLAFPDGFDRRLERACEFALHAHRPDGVIPALSDSDAGSYLDVLELAATIFSRSDFLYVATKGKNGTPPSEKYVSFSEAGYFIQRSGWGESPTVFSDERFLIFDCGPIGDGGHGHYDALSVEIAAGGRPLIVDPGRFTYHEGKVNWRHWFKGTAAHNTVCIDGLDQTLYRCGKPKGPVAEAQFVERVTRPNLDLLCGRVTSPSYEVVHTRSIFFIAGEYWVIVDRLKGDVPHDYDLRFHLTPEAMNHTVIKKDDCNNAVIAPGVALIFPADNEPQLEPGWFAPQYGQKISAPVVSVRANAVETVFFTLVMPRELNDPLPAFRVLTEDGSDRISFEVAGVGRNRSAIDRFSWRARTEHSPIGGATGTVRAAGVRASALGSALVVQEREVSTLGCVPDCATELLSGADPAYLAADPALPERDLLLDEQHMAARLCSLIGAASVDSCTKERVKYRIGESLRVLYRLTVNGHRHLIAARAFAGPSPRTALRVFPDDRKIEHLSSLRDKPQTLSRVFADTWHHSEGVAYVPEKCATVRCVDREGHTIGYAKMYAAGEGQGVYTTYRELASVCPRVVTPVEYVESHRLLLLDVVPGTRIADLKPEQLIDGFAGLAQTLGSLHSAPIPSHLSRFQRHDIDRLRNCAHVVSTARPDVAEVARELVGDLLSTVPAAEPLVCLHGDVHPKNGIFLDGCVTLIDLDQSAVGSAASDLGSLLALLHYNRRLGLITRVEERELASAFLNAYARFQKLPSHRSLSWHTAAALLSERALRSVNRIRPEGLRQLSQLLDDAREILRTGGVRS